jgi:hypothetical protein
MACFPCLRDGSIHFGPVRLRITDCTIDTLIDSFGLPENHGIMAQDPRIRILDFSHVWGRVVAFVKFQNGESFYPMEMDSVELTADRGQLVEIQLELDEPLPLARLGMPKNKVTQGNYQFALYRKRFLARLINGSTFDALSFYNLLHISKAKDTFLFQQYFSDFGVAPATRITLQVAELRKKEAKEHKNDHLKFQKFLDKGKNNPAIN